MPSPPPLFDESKKKKKPVSSTAGPSAQPSASSSRSQRELELAFRGGPPPAPRAARRGRDEKADFRQQQSPPQTTTRKNKQPARSPSPSPVRGAPDVRSARGDEGQRVIKKLLATMQKYKPKLHLEYDSQSEVLIMRGSLGVCSEDDAMRYLTEVNFESSAYKLVYEHTPRRDYRYSLLLENMKQLDGKTKKRLAENMNHQLDKLNKNEHAVYLQGFEEKHNRPFDLKAHYKETLKRIHFQMETASGMEVWDESDGKPSDALDRFVNSKPLVLECMLAIKLSYLCMYKKMLGASALNQLFDGVLHKVYEDLPRQWKKGERKYFHLSYNSIPRITGYYKGSFKKERQTVEYGKSYYIQGPQHAFNFHPSSEANGFNVLYTGKNEEGQDVFRGFDPPDRADKTQQEFETMMEKKYQEPLTVEDLRMLCKREGSEMPPDGVMTFRETMDILRKAYGKSLDKALKNANKAKPEEYYKASEPEISVPEKYNEHRCRGLVAYVQWI
ncbi:uncharacterized protein EAE97_003508 [Botrytis byssoidea]|uniref:Uncharacterized protein n=1 Tax=Botrytis byssoidea TaxID=139641 RepID=A0A9P5IN60_9HELO|nr:uncharacterized protein EAE97_003508 [Botrytis byssoidea]KAF7948097.1 hypothetical protein EAE97_003508 [Botrytis byssoidea]